MDTQLVSIDKHNRLEYLDVLRGVAASAVVVHHFFGYIYHEFGSDYPLRQFVNFITAESVNWGLFGVVLFFLISGFIIPASLKPGATIKKFFISRVFRLYPAYWFVLVLILVSANYIGLSNAYPYSQFFANLTMVPKLFGSNEMSGVFWTLFIEIIFYISCAVLFYLKWLDKPLVIGVSAIALNMTTVLAIIGNKFFQLGIPVQFILFHLSFLFAGNLLRLALVEKNKSAMRLATAFLLIAICSIPIVTGFVFPVLEAKEKGLVLFEPSGVLYAYFLAICLFMYAINFKSISNKYLAELGRVSYSLYLLHMLCLILVAQFIVPNTVVSFLFFLILSISISYFAAKLSYTHIELPAVDLGRKIIQSRSVK
ncbi:acyltransferase family protein [Methylotenera sp. N17]|uniref:acyltransferase family protein n=1 Tax=Methylotenera sp. N17 TaxID=1502761 RepID=UPI000646BEE5|nr:acyltransferase [Methylotenera sp. N17]